MPGAEAVEPLGQPTAIRAGMFDGAAGPDVLGMEAGGLLVLLGADLDQAK
jgi:hypothetical protein